MSAPRRSFLKSLALTPLLPAALGRAAAPPPPSPAPAPPPSSDAPSPMALALAEAARHRFGARIEAGDIDKMRKAIHGNLQAADRLHKVKLANSDEPVTRFLALPPGATPGAAGPEAETTPMTPPDDVLFTPVRALGAMLRAGKVTSVELTELSLHRLETIGPRLGALATLMRERSRARRRRRASSPSPWAPRPAGRS